MYCTDNLLNDKNNKRCLIRIIWEMKFEVEFRLTIQFSLLLLDMKVRHQLPMDSVQVDLLPSFRESLMLTNFQVNEPGLSTRTPSQRQVNQLEFPAMLFQNRDKYFYPHNVVKRSHTTAALHYSTQNCLTKLRIFLRFYHASQSKFESNRSRGS